MAVVCTTATCDAAVEHAHDATTASLPMHVRTTGKMLLMLLLKASVPTQGVAAERSHACAVMGDK